MLHEPCLSKRNDPLKEKSFKQTPQNLAKTLWTGFKFLFGGYEKSFTANRVEAEEFARERFAKLLRQPFPGRSDREIAQAWAPRLQRSDRQIMNWLACTHSASITDMTIVGATHGIWQTASIFVGEDSRADVMKRIAQR
jgi:hypothetical protein